MDAVVHLANIPTPDIHTPVSTFTANTAMNHNVFNAAMRLGLRRVVWASTTAMRGYVAIGPDHGMRPRFG